MSSPKPFAVLHPVRRQVEVIIIAKIAQMCFMGIPPVEIVLFFHKTTHIAKCFAAITFA